MREAIGQTISLQIILVFMVFLNAFLAFSVNYTKAFRVKNKIINEIEQNEGLNQVAHDNIERYMNQVGYNADLQARSISGNRTNDNSYVCRRGACIKFNCIGPLGSDTKKCDGSTKYRAYYSVVTVIDIKVPIISRILDSGWSILQVKGDTSTIYMNTRDNMVWGS